MTDKDADRTIPERLRHLRETMGWSQAELARQFGVAPPSANRWESGENEMSGPALKLLELFERKAKKFEEQD